jgi:hypothetical protein
VYLFLPIFVSVVLVSGEGTNMPVSQTESTRAREVENVAMHASVREDAKGLICKVALLEGELAVERQAWEVSEEKLHSLSDASTDGTRRLVVSEMDGWEQSRSFPFCMLGVPSCVLPLLVRHK